MSAVEESRYNGAESRFTQPSLITPDSPLASETVTNLFHGLFPKVLEEHIPTLIAERQKQRIADVRELQDMLSHGLVGKYAWADKDITHRLYIGDYSPRIGEQRHLMVIDWGRKNGKNVSVYSVKKYPNGDTHTSKVGISVWDNDINEKEVSCYPIDYGTHFPKQGEIYRVIEDRQFTELRDAMNDARKEQFQPTQVHISRLSSGVPLYSAPVEQVQRSDFVRRYSDEDSDDLTPNS